MAMPKPLKLYYLASLGFWICCMSFLGVWRFVMHLPFPYRSPFMPSYPLRDLWCYRDQFARLHSISFFQETPWEKFPYPPGAALPFAFFNNLMPKLLPDARKILHGGHRIFPTIVFLLLTFGAVAALGWAAARGIERLGVGPWKSRGLILAAFWLTFPFAFEAVTGNIEIVIYLALASATLAFLRGRFVLAAMLIGFAGSMKFYPFVLVALFLPVRRWKEIGIAVASFVGFLLAGLWLESPDLGVAYRGVREAMAINRVDYMQAYMVPQSMADHSIFGLIKMVLHAISGSLHHGPRSVTAYTAAMAVVGITLYFARIRHLPLLNQICCLYVSFVLLVPESFEYTLIHLSVPLVLLMLYAFQRQKEQSSVQGLTPVFLSFAFVLSAQNELLFHGNGYWGQAKCVTLMVLLVLALTRRWEGFARQGWVTPELQQEPA